MSKLFSSVEIATLALRRISALPTSETAPEGEELRVSLQFLDLVLSELSGTSRIYSQVGPSLAMILKPGVTSYALKDALGEGFPKSGLVNPVSVWASNLAGRQYEVPIVTREVFERYKRFPETGAPECVYIDREPSPTVYLFPPPRADDVQAWFLELVYQEQAPNVSPNGVANSVPEDQAHSLRHAWQLWLVKKLAYEIGCGPVAALPEGRLSRLDRDQRDAYSKLEARDNHEHSNLPPIQHSWEPGSLGQGPILLDYFKRLN